MTFLFLLTHCFPALFLTLFWLNGQKLAAGQMRKLRISIDISLFFSFYILSGRFENPDQPDRKGRSDSEQRLVSTHRIDFNTKSIQIRFNRY